MSPTLEKENPGIPEDQEQEQELDDYESDDYDDIEDDEDNFESWSCVCHCEEKHHKKVPDYRRTNK